MTLNGEFTGLVREKLLMGFAQEDTIVVVFL